MTDEKPAETSYAPGADLPEPPVGRPAVGWRLMLLLFLVFGATAVILWPNFVRSFWRFIWIHGTGRFE